VLKTCVLEVIFVQQAPKEPHKSLALLENTINCLVRKMKPLRVLIVQLEDFATKVLQTVDLCGISIV